MSISESSIILRFFLAVWLGLKNAAVNSGANRLCLRLERGWRRLLSGSVLWRFAWREGAVSKAWSGSISCRLFTAIVNIPCAIVKALYKAGRPVWDASLFCRLLRALGGASFFFMGLFMMVMLMAPHSMWNNTYALLGAMALTALFIAGSASRRQYRLELDTLGPYMTIYMAFICLALLGSLSTHMSMRFFAFHLTSFLLVLVVVSSIHKYEQLQLMVSLAVLGLSVAALYGCYQGHIGVEVVPSQQDMVVNAGMPGRVYSFFDNPNNFAEQLEMLLPLNLALFLNCRWRGKLLSFISLCLGVAAIGFTYGRASWIGLTLAVLVFVALLDWRWIPVLIVLGLAAVPFLPETIYNRILTIGNTEDSSTQYRFAIYDTTANLMKDYWVRGVGLGSDIMKKVFQTYPTNFDGSYPIHTHNNYLQMWGEAGIWGILSFLGLLVWQLKKSVKAFQAAADPRVKRMLAAAGGAFCGICVIGLAEYTWFYPRNMFTYWFLFGVIAACVKLVKAEKPTNA